MPPDRHKQTPISIRPPGADRAWLEAHAAETGRPVRAIITAAIAAERARQEAGTMNGSLAARIGALDDFGRTSVLRYLIGYAPQALAAALDEIESQSDEAILAEIRRAAAQAAEDSHG